MILSAWLVPVFPLHPFGFASAALAPALFGIQFVIIALIGMTLPIGVATKNAILMINSAP
jgi:multidrug efflux pump subunit AcrB